MSDTIASDVVAEHAPDLRDARDSLRAAHALLPDSIPAAHVEFALLRLDRFLAVLDVLRRDLEHGRIALAELRSIAAVSPFELYDETVVGSDLVLQADAAIQRIDAS